MFVFRKNTLKKQIVPVRGDEAAMRLIHEPSGVHLEFGFLTDPEVDIENDPKALTMDGLRVNMTTPYKIYKLKDDNSYLFYKEHYERNQSLTDNFKGAIAIFEQSIFEQLNEKAPQPTNEQAEAPEESDKFSALPEVGDFVVVDGRYGRVVDVDEKTRMVKIDKMTRDEVMSILRAQSNMASERATQQMPQSVEQAVEEIFGAINPVRKDDGGFISMDDDFFVVQVDEQGSNLTILRINEQPQGGQGGQEEPPSGGGEPQPDNVQDPFQEQGNGEGDGGGDDQGGDQGGDQGDDQSGDQSGDQGGDQSGDQSGDQGGDQGDGGDDGGQDGEGQNQGGQGGGQCGDGQCGFPEGDIINATPTPIDEEFGEDDFFSEEDLEQALNDVQERLEDEKVNELMEQAKNDLKVVANALSLTEENIRGNFLSKTEMRAAIGGRQIFSSNNEQRILNVINLIFSNK